MISLPKLIYRLVLAVADGPPLVFTAAHVSSPHRDLRCRARFSLGAVYLSERAGLYGASFILTGFTDANDNPKQILKSPEAE